MTKKLSLLFALMLSTLMASAYDAQVDGVYYNLIAEAKQAEVTSGDTKYTGNVTIPESFTYNGVTYSVTSIRSQAFQSCTDLTSVTIPNSVTSIGNNAFWFCSGLTSVTIPNSVTSIESWAFAGCSGLTSVTIGNSVTSIGESAFSGCSKLNSVTIPNSVVSIENSALSGCSGLTSINIPNSVTSIGSFAFNGCKSLNSVTIPNSVTSIGDGAFSSCTGELNINCNPKSNSFKGNKFNSVNFGNDVTTIDGSTFCNNQNLTSIILGSDVESVGDKAFAEDPKLEKIVSYAKNVPTTSRSAFDDSYIDYVTLYVPASSLDAYKSTAPWKNAAQILPLEDYKEKCATPTILFENEKLSFSCETEGVKYVYNFSTPSESDEDGKGINMPNKLQVSVYAKKDGFENSEVTTKEIDLGTSGIRGDVNNDGTVNMPDAMFIVNKILNGKFPDE